MASRCWREAFCKYCNEELVHRDNRGGDESSSEIGQIIHKHGPAQISAMDIDLSIMKFFRGNEQVLLRLIEHKNRRHDLGEMQARQLSIYAEMMDHYLKCPHQKKFTLHPDSGVLLALGDIRHGVFPNQPRITRLDGTVVLEPPTMRDLGDFFNGGIKGWTTRAPGGSPNRRRT